MTVTTSNPGSSPFDPGPAPARATDVLKDFSANAQPILFRIDGDIFEAPARIPAQVMLDFVEGFNQLGEKPDMKDQVGMMMGMIDLVLQPQSAELFRRRMGDRDNPIDLEQVQDVLPWLMEQYGMRPTEPSDTSSDGQPSLEPGTDSTATSPAPASISVVSPPTDFSTSSTG